MFEFAINTIDMTAAEILNYYRNLYYAESQVTERGIVANAINDYFQEAAPRAEVEELQAECNKWQERLKTECEYAEAITKKKVAREIFEEIDKIIEKHHSECYEYEDGDECDTAITYISYLSVDIAELKKKYTEGKDDT